MLASFLSRSYRESLEPPPLPTVDAAPVGRTGPTTFMPEAFLMFVVTPGMSMRPEPVKPELPLFAIYRLPFRPSHLAEPGFREFTDA
jgi:hypothetical protein